MNYSKVIHLAWQLVNTQPKLKWFAFIPSFVAVLVFVLEVLWQLYLYFSEFGVIDSHINIESIKSTYAFLMEKSLIFWVILTVIFILFFTFIMPSWIRGTLILGIQHAFEKEDTYLSIRQKMIESSNYFFRIFELHALLSPFQYLSIALFVATFYRYYHDSLFTLLVPLLIVHVIISTIIQILFAFTPYFIVEEDATLGEGLKKSIGLVFLNFGTTLAIIFLMFLVNFRVIVNVFVILGVPIVILGSFSYFASSFALTISIIIGIALISLAAYLTAIIEVFSTAVWERAFATLRHKQELIAEKKKNEEE